ncbi:hypothetical protein Tco_1109405 [Tanacetum coccineum]
MKQDGNMTVPANGCLKMHAHLVDVDTEKCIVDKEKELRESGSSNGVSTWTLECDVGIFELRVIWVHQARSGSSKVKVYYLFTASSLFNSYRTYLNSVKSRRDALYLKLSHVLVAKDSLAVPEQTTVETATNMTPENRAHFKSKKEAIHLILTVIGDEIYSTVHAFNELCAERMAKNANQLALVATAQTFQDPYYQTSKPHKSYAPKLKASLPTRSHATTRYKGKEIAKPITPPSESVSEEDSDPEQA